MLLGSPKQIAVGLLAFRVSLGCSILLILGQATRLAVLPLAFTIIVALFIVHGADPWQGDRSKRIAHTNGDWCARPWVRPGAAMISLSLSGSKTQAASERDPSAARGQPSFR